MRFKILLIEDDETFFDCTSMMLSDRKNIYLCTNNYDDMDLIKQARSIGVKVLPKPLIFLRLAQTL